MRVLILVVLALALAVPAYAMLDDNSTKQGQAQGQLQGQAAIAAQAQGQLGLVGQKAENAQTTNIGGDETDVTTAVWPTVPSTPAKEEKALYSLFGGIGSNKTEEHVKIQQAMELASTLHKEGVITDAEYKIELQVLYKQLKAALKPQKLLGVLPIAQRGCNIINVCGLLTW